MLGEQIIIKQEASVCTAICSTAKSIFSCLTGHGTLSIGLDNVVCFKLGSKLSRTKAEQNQSLTRLACHTFQEQQPPPLTYIILAADVSSFMTSTRIVRKLQFNQVS